MVLGSISRPKPPPRPPPPPAARRRNRTALEDDHVVLRREVAGVERLRIDDRERELELLEQPARVARRHRAAVLIPQRDALRLQLERIGARHGATCRRTRVPSPSRASAASASCCPWTRCRTCRPDTTCRSPSSALLSQYTSLPALSARFTAMNASFVVVRAAGSPTAPDDATVPAGGFGHAGDRLDTGRRSRRGCDRTSRPSGTRASSRRCRTAASAAHPDTRSRSGDPAARTCRARAGGTPAPSSRRTSRPDSSCRRR